MTLRLRPAGEGDAALLLEWRNDPGTRESAFNSDEVAPDEHRAWLARRLADPESAIYIAEEDDRPVGQVRLDREGEVAEVDIAVAPAERGRGLGSEMLRLAAREAGATALRARVKSSNQASLRAFRSAGFSLVEEAGGVVELLLTSPRE